MAALQAQPNIKASATHTLLGLMACRSKVCFSSITSRFEHALYIETAAYIWNIELIPLHL